MERMTVDFFLHEAKKSLNNMPESQARLLCYKLLNMIRSEEYLDDFRLTQEHVGEIV